MEHGEEEDSGLTEEHVQQSDGRFYEVPWTVYTALALPCGKLSTNSLQRHKGSDSSRTFNDGKNPF